MSGLSPKAPAQRCASAELAVADRPAPYPKPAAGLPAVLNSLRYAAQTAGVVRGTRALLLVNQPAGFDCPGCAWPEPGHRAMAEFCENGARAVVHEADRRRVDAEFFARHGLSELRQKSSYWLEQQGRLVAPMVRRPGDDHYRPISYAEAFALIAEQLRRLPSADHAAFYTSGRASNEAAFLYQLLARQLGTNNLPDCSNLCHESSGKGLGAVLGVGKGTVTLEDFDHADCIFLFGQNPGTNHPRMLTTLANAVARGAQVIAVNPLRETGLTSFAHPQKVSGMLGFGQKVATHHVQVRIGGDIGFLQGVQKALLELPGSVDEAFVGEHTQGAEAQRALCAARDWAELEQASGVSQAAMREIAAVYAHSQRTIACWAMGITQHKHGVANVREIVNLLLWRGNLGRQGAGVCPVRGHSNVQGDRTMGIYEAPSEAFLQRLDQGMHIQSPRHHGYDAVGAVMAMERGELPVFVGLGGNFAEAMSDTARTCAALERCALTVQIATKLNRSHLHVGETALLLPCLGRTERDVRGGAPQFVTVEDSMSMVHKSQGNLAPADPGLESEVGIVAGIGHALFGDAPVPWSSFANDYDRIRDAIERSIDGFSDFNRRVRSRDGFLLPNTARVRTWLTQSGKAQFSTHPLPTFDGLSEPGRLLLMTIRSHDQFNTTIYDLQDRYRGIYGERHVVFVHPDDLRERGFAPGEQLTLRSHFAGQERVAHGFRAVPYDVPRGCVAAYYPETNPLVPLESFADESRTPTSKSVVVSLERSLAALPQ